ncbi:MAG: fumarylacetoacetate hydrolase family protein [Chloroflexota bacterium]
MRLVTYQINESPRIGALTDDKVIDLHAASGDENFPATMIDLLQEGQIGLDRVSSILASGNASEFAVDVADITFLPPVLNPVMVIALGRNYAAHAAEGGAKPPDYPMLFHKTSGSLLGAGGTIVLPPIDHKIDYEGELAVVMGRTCKQVSPEEALDYVAGYTVANDVSARGLQRRTSQFSAGKMLDTFGPLGPALVTRDEVPDPGNLSIRTILNDQVMQDDTTSNMIFDVPFTISYISQFATLHPGDVILTGTPEGVGYPRNPPVFLKDGDTVSVEIESLGTLTNYVKDQA